MVVSVTEKNEARAGNKRWGFNLGLSARKGLAEKMAFEYVNVQWE